MRETLPRFFAEGEIVAGGEVALSAGETRHARVRRLAAGDRVEVLDGRGRTGRGVLAGSGDVVAVDAVAEGEGEPALRWIVAIGAAEPARVEWAVEKGTECGAAGFLLYAASRSQGTHVRALGAKVDRLAKVAAEAVKQCGRSVVPGIRGPVPFRSLLESGPSLVAVPGAGPLGAADRAAFPGGGLVVVGPEGGLTEAERADLERAGARPFGLGPRVLRVETAVVAALTRLVDPIG